MVLLDDHGFPELFDDIDQFRQIIQLNIPFSLDFVGTIQWFSLVSATGTFDVKDHVGITLE
ncbi:hypothetical protein FZC83_08750 [Rossellomorea marisflavi]|uniref:Uncharacterized protein n=1 Tax=Rossellomorea marisflavi TaxID=189381 RepID=A0A5D4RUH2_9BACI|nr:hypothetical protein [Rossellomorea marisflavi]TYS55025.1 hypothetical protein FZC83_08750 [Rossellomorea marisflavi]